jgi:hypothetical protein
MINLDDARPPVVEAYWINEEDYPALLKILADGNRMPRIWKEWLKIAEEMERGLMSSCAFTSIRAHFRTGVPPMVRAPVVKDAQGSSPQPLPRDTAIKIDRCAFWSSDGLRVWVIHICSTMSVTSPLITQ